MKQPSAEGSVFAVLTPSSWLTLCGGVVSTAAVFLFIDAMSTRGHEHWVGLGAACMFSGLLCDAFDGLLARRFHWESDFGKQLDSLCDTITLLVAPAVALRALGARGLWPSLAELAMVGAGFLRLARFTITGNLETERGLAYVGMPCFYSHFAVVGLVFVHAYAPRFFEPVLIAVLLPMSWLFVSRWTFPKPKSPLIIFSTIGALIVGSLMVFVLRLPI
jgi:CDP-diacylglycerol---serine O-phosphatidyltransferase